MKVDIEALPQEEKFKVLKLHKNEIIEQKKLRLTYTDPLSFTPSIKVPEVKKNLKLAENALNLDPTNSILVTVVCNTSWFCMNNMDVIAGTAYDKSVALKGISIPHIADHAQISTSHVGDVQKVYTENLSVESLGIKNSDIKEVPALIMETIIRKDYNEKVFQFYSNGKINQHSIGLSYQNIELALNSQVEEDKAEYEVWQKNFPNIINKDFVKEKGYFWLLSDIDIRENSCVLFGANPLTPTLYNLSSKNLETQEPEEIPNVNNLLKGNNNMATPLEEALVKLSERETEVLTLKSTLSLEIVKATKLEKERCLGILEAGKTYALNLDTITDNIKEDFTVPQTVKMFTAIKEQVQKLSGLDTSIGLTSTVDTRINPSNVLPMEKAFSDALANFSKNENLFKGVI